MPRGRVCVFKEIPFSTCLTVRPPYIKEGSDVGRCLRQLGPSPCSTRESGNLINFTLGKG